MRLPGFSAEAALSRTTERFRVSLDVGMDLTGGVIASRRAMAIAGCGSCTELKWPNGTGTGACVQDCCDALGNCKIQACTCGGGGSGIFTRGFGGFGSGSVFAF